MAKFKKGDQVHLQQQAHGRLPKGRMYVGTVASKPIASSVHGNYYKIKINGVVAPYHEEQLHPNSLKVGSVISAPVHYPQARRKGFPVPISVPVTSTAKLKGEPGAAQGGSGKHGGNPCHDAEGKFC